MAMSKKDFIALADTVKAFSETNAGKEMDPYTRNVFINHLSRFCEEQNPRFMRDRWLSYIAGECGKNGGAVKKIA